MPAPRVRSLLNLSAPGDNVRWRERSACREADPLLMTSDEPRAVAVAKLYCLACPVLVECREWVDSVEPLDPKCNSGTWAAEDPDERAARRRRTKRRRYL